MRNLRSLALPLIVTAGLFAGCGDDDDSTTEATPPASAAVEPPATTPSEPSESAATVAADNKITVDASEFKFDPDAIEAAAGKLEVTLNNGGQAPHEFVVIKTDAAADSLPVKDNRVDERDSQGEIAEIQGGQTGKHTFDLKPGKYVFVCNVPGHYADGMHGTLTVK